MLAFVSYKISTIGYMIKLPMQFTAYIALMISSVGCHGNQNDDDFDRKLSQFYRIFTYNYISTFVSIDGAVPPVITEKTNLDLTVSSWLGFRGKELNSILPIENNESRVFVFLRSKTELEDIFNGNIVVNSTSIDTSDIDTEISNGYNIVPLYWILHNNEIYVPSVNLGMLVKIDKNKFLAFLNKLKAKCIQLDVPFSDEYILPIAGM